MNLLMQELIDLGIITREAITEYYPRVRDRDDVSVLRCSVSGVIFLNRIDHMVESHYSEQSGTSYWNEENRTAALLKTKEDDNRRFNQWKSLIENKKYCDVGCGHGGGLERMSELTSEAVGVELQREIRELLNSSGFKVVNSLEKIDNDFDVITMFHVFEHMLRPLDTLRQLRGKLKTSGKIIIEVPHANDVLLKSYNLDAFKAFTLWSEHLVLHTHKSLQTYLEAAGFRNIEIRGYQRYPLANHLHWLRAGEPGGENVLKRLNIEELNRAYATALEDIKETDTIIAIAEA